MSLIIIFKVALVRQQFVTQHAVLFHGRPLRLLLLTLRLIVVALYLGLEQALLLYRQQDKLLLREIRMFFVLR
jgi:hypothetical protein